jgi:DNA-binding response OmpR family regulator
MLAGRPTGRSLAGHAEAVYRLGSEGNAVAEAQTILVVDDDRDLNDALRIFLEKHGFRVLQASNGHDGQRLIEQRHPDVVVLDMMMPGRGGYPVLEHLRGNADAPPVVMITANEGSRHQAYAESLGVVDYVRKPFAMERLLESVQKGLAQGAAKDAPSPAERAGP